jgi:starch phosphorylase
MTTSDLRGDVLRHLRYSLGKDEGHAQIYDWRVALSLAVRDRIVDRWFAATRATYAGKHKRVYYLSMEFLIGRLLEDAMTNLGVLDDAKAVFDGFGLPFDRIVEDEPDAALGNGGLGRLAACFMESLATLCVPAYGYGIRYEHGLFRQRFEGGRQIEEPEDWLTQAHVWEFERPEAAFEIGFGGHVHRTGTSRGIWRPAEAVIAQGFDTPVVGWQGRWSNTLRLWGAQPTRLLDLERFNAGDYTAAAQPETLARTISRVLYPDDTTDGGKALRLKQEYFFTAASLRDILRRFESEYDDLRKLPQKVAIQLNDTHPAIAGPELVRLLHDERGLPFDEAMETARLCLNYTNHTLLPEALESWSEGLMGYLLPRHLQIIEAIDAAHHKAYPARAVHIREHGQVKMGNLSFIMARRVNGVSALHTDLMKRTVFRELHGLHPERIVNETNGVTPRRWLWGCNPGLRNLLNETIGEDWVTDLDRLREIEPLAEDEDFRARFASVKAENKRRLARWLDYGHGVRVDPHAMFDIQIKRIHEYKRQLMNALETAALRNAIRRDPDARWTPRVKIFGGKAAPGYAMAKLIIKLINDIARTINADPACKGRLSVVFPANYNVSMAEILIPAADLSEQISTAGKEASGTGNMKFSMNGALTIGTLDGANVEIREAVGAENFFLFGQTADEVLARRAAGYDPSACIAEDARLAEVVDQIASGTFSPEEPNRYDALLDNLRHHDWFQVAADFPAYYEAQRAVDRAWRDPEAWRRMAILNAARMGQFSSDRTIRGYARDVWNVEAAF